jgi:hypothetical protein
MKIKEPILVAVALLIAMWFSVAFGQQENTYPWFKATDGKKDVAGRITAPAGYQRVRIDPGSFADWLRHLPLKPDGTPVYLFNGSRKVDQSVHAAVLDIDTGSMDLQQCADAVIRLRAEYLYSKKLFDAIHFDFTSGQPASYVRWRAGFRPEVKGNTVRWVKKAAEDTSYESFRSYLRSVFTYAGSQSLCRELESIQDVIAMEIGDVFIHGGSPGHAVLVVDMAEKKTTGDKVFLLAQSYMPAQDIHILKNLNDTALSPWYPITFGDMLRTPEWEFKKTELRRFKTQGRTSGSSGHPTVGR